MKKTFYLLFLFFLIPFFGEARYYGSQITYKYAKPENRLYITVKYWRYCDDTIDPLVANILVEMPGCDNFTVPIAKTTITDVSIHKNLHPNAICVLPNAKNAGRGLEEFVSTASFALDTAPFASAAANGCCNVYLTAQIGSLRPSETTTGQRLDFHTNFALINICNLLGMDTEELSSPGFLMPMFTDRITCNNTATIDFGAYSMSSADSLSFEMAAPLGVSRTNVLGHFAPLSVSSPMTTYCPNGFSRPCIPIANASPAIGFSVNHKTGALTFHPIDCNEKGVVVLQAVQWIKDTNRVWKLAGMVRRDFTILVNGAVNNQPELLGPYDFQVIKGDTLNFKVFTKDAPVVVPPPGLSKMDTTYLIVKNSSTRIKYSIIDATKRERELAVSYVADSADVSKTLVCAVLAHDNDSLPLRTMRAYRIKVLEKLIVSTQLTPKSCGIMELDLLMDSLNYSNFKSGSPVLRLEGQGFNKTFNLDSGINRIQLPAPGLFSYKLEVYGKNYGFSQADTFSYNQEMVRIDKQKRNFSFCYSSPSKPILPLVYANQNRILQYQWLKSGVLQTNDNFYIVTAAERINFKVNSANCADSLDFNIDSFNYPFRKRHEITVFEPYCDTLKLRQFFGTYFFSDSLLVAMQGIADPNLLETNMAYFTCAAFPASNNVNRTILLQQRNREEGCLIADTIHLILLNKPFMFSDDSFCNQLKEMDLANFSNKANEANESKIKFTLKREGVDISNKLSIDSSLGAIHFYNLSL